jgi:hypothetical protein
MAFPPPRHGGFVIIERERQGERRASHQSDARWGAAMRRLIVVFLSPECNA